MVTHNERTYPGKIRSIGSCSNWPSVSIRTFRRVGGKVYEDLLQLVTAFPPQIGESVQGADGDYHKVVGVVRTYPDGSEPIIQVTCEFPTDVSYDP